jgi:hypothetical protein
MHGTNIKKSRIIKRGVYGREVKSYRVSVGKIEVKSYRVSVGKIEVKSYRVLVGKIEVKS